MTAITQLGPYRIERLLGDGGMASVYKAYHTDLRRYEALKLLPTHLAHDRSFVERFLGEARTAARLNHASIVMIYTVGSSDARQPYFTMELVGGGDLADFLASRGRLRVGEAAPLLLQLAGALDYAHQQGVIHRDVKPANVLLDRSTGEIVAKLADFGIARSREAVAGGRLTPIGMIVGSPPYMSPEQCGNGYGVDGRTDQYSLGILAYEMLCGSPPFPAEAGSTPISVIVRHLHEKPTSVSSLVPDVPEGVSRAVLRALAKKPEERFASCTEFVQAIIHGSEPKSRGVQLPVKPPSDPQSIHRRRAPALAVGALVIIGAAMIGAATAPIHHDPGNSGSGPVKAGNPGGRVVNHPSIPPAVITNPQDGAEMILIPAGPFLMGDDDMPNNPRHTVSLGDYYIYKYPVTVRQYMKYCLETGHNKPAAPEFGWHDDDPVVNVTWNDARDYCKWASKGRIAVHLPREDQWEKAARGVHGQKYPFGDTWDSSKCVNSVSPAKADGPESVLSHPKGVSPFGVMQMAGNVWQWCEDNYDGSGDGRRVLRGGSWYFDNVVFFRSSYRCGYSPDLRYDLIGFRCAAGP